jgi:hypothetical protein
MPYHFFIFYKYSGDGNRAPNGSGQPGSSYESGRVGSIRVGIFLTRVELRVGPT